MDKMREIFVIDSADVQGLDGFLHAHNRDLGDRALAVRMDAAAAGRTAHPRLTANADALAEALRQARAGRADSVDVAGLGLATARELEHRYARVFEEKLPVQNAARLFPSGDQGILPGMRTHTLTRLYGQGTAAVYRSGPVPMVGMGKGEYTANIRHYVNGFVLDIFDEMSLGRLNIAAAGRFLGLARRAMAEFANRATWFGLPEHGIVGVLNYPWLPKYAGATAMTWATAPEVIVDELHRLASINPNRSKSVHTPTAIAMADRLYRMISQRRMSVDNTQTILQAFLAGSSWITSVEPVWELSGIGPGNTDGLFFYRAGDPDSVSNVVIQPFTPMPLQIKGFAREQLCYMTHGGVIQPEVGSNLLAWVQGPA